MSVGSDDNGDFVVAWAAYDPARAADGSSLTDPRTGATLTDANIYARYLTNEVQQLDLSSVPTTAQSISLQFGQEVQELSFSGTTEPVLPEDIIGQPIIGTVYLRYTDHQGKIDNIPIGFNESWGPETNALNIQAALRSIPDLGQVTVTAIDADNFWISYPGSFYSAIAPTLTKTAGPADQTLLVTSTAALPQSGTFSITLDSEHLLVSVPSTALQAAIGPSDMTLQVASTAGMPLTGTFTVSVAGGVQLPEHMLVSVADATHLTVIARAPTTRRQPPGPPPRRRSPP